VTTVVNINDVIDGHVVLDLACVDRLYLNAYVLKMLVGPQVNRFCRDLGQTITSPVVVERFGNRFRRKVDAFARITRFRSCAWPSRIAPAGMIANWITSAPISTRPNATAASGW
jgi:hypothetical protein